MQITGQNILKLAENSPEWRKALRQLAQKRDLQPKTPMLRRLLELAENPPPHKKFKPQQTFFLLGPWLSLVEHPADKPPQIP
ncbi:MAG: hypothetical protein LM573_07270, partial [Thermofilum sp.]|nr:hypothetical protein [Thermofilum sp.]